MGEERPKPSTASWVWFGFVVVMVGLTIRNGPILGWGSAIARTLMLFGVAIVMSALLPKVVAALKR